jgi:hypothetical protein
VTIAQDFTLITKWAKLREDETSREKLSDDETVVAIPDAIADAITVLLSYLLHASIAGRIHK